MQALLTFLSENGDLVWRLTGEHLMLALTGTALGFLVAFPMAVAASRLPRAGRVLSTVANVGQTIPSFAVLGLAIPLLGIGTAPTLLALALRALLPIYLNTWLALTGIDPAIREAARGLGMTSRQQLLQIELPLGLPAILGGLRTASVEAVGIATLAAFIGGGGLGDLILQGIALRDTTRLLAGALPVALLAIVVELGLGGIERLVGRHVGARPAHV